MLFFLYLSPLSVLSQVTCKEQPKRIFNFTVVSDYFTQILDANLKSQGQAVNCRVNPAWTASVPGANWIWESYSGSEDAKVIRFQVQFYIPGVPISGSLRVATDNTHTMTLNGQDIGCNESGFWAGSERDCIVLPYLVTGLNTAIFSAENQGGPGALIFGFNFSSIV